MSRIHSKNTGLEIQMKRTLQRAGFRFQSHPKIEGTPDFLIGGRLTVFCDGGFWHGRNWRALREKLKNGSNAQYWIEHIARNKKRDSRVNAILRCQGDKVLRFWDDEILRHPDRCTRKIVIALKGEADKVGMTTVDRSIRLTPIGNI
jgi:DNA mismatch endonuclease (patch repair protein)